MAFNVANDEFKRIYKIEDVVIWQKAQQQGTYLGSPVDIADGFIHLSTATQARQTAAKHYSGKPNLVIATINANLLGAELKWEKSRGGALFPHFYGVLLMEAVIATRPLPLDDKGIHVFSEDVF